MQGSLFHGEADVEIIKAFGFVSKYLLDFNLLRQLHRTDMNFLGKVSFAMTKETAISDATLSARIIAPPEHAQTLSDICAQLDGQTTERPDGTLTCEFTAPVGETTHRFKVKADQINAGRAVCQQLGGTFATTASGATCDFRLPQDPQWNVHALSETTALVRFDSDTVYTAAANPGGMTLQALRNGDVLEQVSLVHTSEDGRMTISLKGAGADTSKLHIVNTQGRTEIHAYFRDDLVFQCDDSVFSIREAFTRHYAKHPESRVAVPYLSLLLERVNRDAPFRGQLEPFLGVYKEPLYGTVEYFCVAACALCIGSGDPHACTACWYCHNHFTAEPPVPG